MHGRPARARCAICRRRHLDLASSPAQRSEAGHGALSAGDPIMSSRVLIALAALSIILSLTLAACGSPDPDGASRPAAVQTPLSTTTVATSTSTPAAPTECGFVHFGPPGLSPANYQQLID